MYIQRNRELRSLELGPRHIEGDDAVYLDNRLIASCGNIDAGPDARWIVPITYSRVECSPRVDAVDHLWLNDRNHLFHTYQTWMFDDCQLKYGYPKTYVEFR